MKAFYDQQPSRLEVDNDGTYLFRWNITDVSTEEHTQYMCEEVRLKGNPDIKAVKLAIIRDRYDENKEFSIINKYNSHVLGITDNPDAVDNYTDYLNFLKDIDEVILSNF